MNVCVCVHSDREREVCERRVDKKLRAHVALHAYMHTRAKSTLRKGELTQVLCDLLESVEPELVWACGAAGVDGRDGDQVAVVGSEAGRAEGGARQRGVEHRLARRLQPHLRGEAGLVSRNIMRRKTRSALLNHAVWPHVSASCGHMRCFFFVRKSPASATTSSRDISGLQLTHSAEDSAVRFEGRGERRTCREGAVGGSGT